MIPIRYNARSLLVRRSTTIATALGIALVVFVLSSSQMLVHGIHKTLGNAGSPERAIVLRKGADSELSSIIENRFVNQVLAAPEVKRSAAGAPLGQGQVLMVIVLDKPGTNEVSNVLVRGVPDVGAALPDLRIVEGRAARTGADEVIIGTKLEGKFAGLRMGDTFELKKNRPVKVVGTFAAGESSHESEVIADVELVRSAFAREGLVSSVVVQLRNAEAFEAFKQRMERDKQLGLQALSEPAYYEKQSEGTALLVTFLGGAIVFFFAIGAILGASVTMYAAVSNRKREVGTLRALGFSRPTVVLSFLIEAVLLTALGGAVGALASLALSFVHFSMMNMGSWSEVTFSFDPSPAIIGRALLAGGVMGILGGILPALQAARISPLEALRED